MNRLARRQWAVAAMLLVLAAVPRLAYLVVYPPEHGILGAEMERGAIHLARTGTLGNVYSDRSGPSAHLPPLYPAFLALLYRTFGIGTPASRLAQSLCAIAVASTLICLLPVLAERAKLVQGAGLAAGLSMALLPIGLELQCLGTWEQSYAAACLAGLFAWMLVLHDRRWDSWAQVAALGIALGLCVLLSPILAAAAALMLAGELITQRGCRGRVAAGSALIVLLSVLTVSPWTYRNYVALGGIVPIRSNLGLELWIGNNPQTDGTTFGLDYRGAVNPFSSQEEHDRLLQLGELGYEKEKRQMALAWIGAHPLEFSLRTARRCQWFWFPSPKMWNPNTRLLGFQCLVVRVTGVAALLGLAALFALRHQYRWLFLAALVGPSLVYLVTHVNPRYRYTVYAFTLLLASDLAIRLVGRLRRRFFNRVGLRRRAPQVEGLHGHDTSR